MIYRAFRCNLTDIQLKNYDVAGIGDEIMYRIPGVPHEFVVYPEEICPDCSTPVLDMLDKTSGKATRVWHDETCPTAPAHAKVKLRVLTGERRGRR